MILVKLGIFVVLNAVIFYFSWKSLLKHNSHGFYRFFVFESVLLLILFNLDYWFVKPFSLLQIFSWIFLFFGLLLVIEGFYLLNIVGKPKSRNEDNANIGFENTSNLVTVGAYKYIRHPMYSSLLFLGLGVFLKHPSVLSTPVLLVMIVSLFATASIEEKENIKFFGNNYIEYMKKTRLFIPYVL